MTENQHEDHWENEGGATTPTELPWWGVYQ